MKSPFLKTYLALAVLAALGAYVYLVELKKPASGSDVPKQKVFADLDKAKVEQFRLKPHGEPAVVAGKDGEAWNLREPLTVAADATEVDALLTSVQNLELEEVVSEKPDQLADFGLESPKRTIQVTLDGRTQPLELLLGDKTPDGSSLYAKTAAEPRVFTIASYLDERLGKSAFDLRDRNLLHVERDAIQGLAIRGPSESYALARGADGEWAITRPLETRPARWPVDSLLGMLENLKMDQVAAEQASPAELARFGLAKPARSVAMTLADGSAKTLEIGSSPEAGKYHARLAGSPLVAVIPGTIVDDLSKGLTGLRMKRVADVPTFDIAGFDVTVGGREYRYAKSTEKDEEGFETAKWKRSAPDPKDLDRQTVEDALYKLTSLEAQEFLDSPGRPESYGLDAPALVVTIRLTGDKAPASVEIGRKGEAAFASRRGDQAILKLDAAKVAEAESGLLALGAAPAPSASPSPD